MRAKTSLRAVSPPAEEAELDGSMAFSVLRASSARAKTPQQRMHSPPAVEDISHSEVPTPNSTRRIHVSSVRVSTPQRMASPPPDDLSDDGPALVLGRSASAPRLRGAGTPKRLGSPPAEDIDKPGETCPVGTAFIVLQEMLALKYGIQLDEHDFTCKAKARCTPEERLSALRFVEALNAEPALKVKDACCQRLIQLRFATTIVTTFAELQGFMRRWPGTACAIAAASLGGASGRTAQLVAPYREAYGGTGGIVAKTRAKSYGQVGPLFTLTEETFHGAVVLEPVIEYVLKYQSETAVMLELQVPSESDEFRSVSTGGNAEAELASRFCSAMADLTSTTGDLEGRATASCLLAKELMCRHPKASMVQQAACRALGNLLPLCRRSLPAQHTSAALESVLAAMRRHSKTCEVLEAACSTVASATASWPDLQAVAATNGATEEIISAMRRFPDRAELQAMACGALAGLAANHPMNQSTVTGRRGIEVILAAMDRFGEHAGLQTMACGAFGNLSANHANNQAAIGAAGGLQRVVTAMNTHCRDPAVLTSAMGALWCLVKRHPENLSLAGKLKAAEIAASAVQQHPGDAALRSMATGALQCLVPGLAEAMAGASAAVSSAPPSARPSARPGQTPRAPVR
eukprot:TRINITY_DN26899_c0_g1_i1.p1 TRINITY_DN26899_c0_g1~~TRINITY_DN26899_c0_g1_i1.p1  ORF type:complete len:634 (+),score=113.29 TRINITY_DN26899_c0_g1_i1:146-2047(+)